jgi:hypothetical protein
MINMLTRFNCKSVIELLQTALARVNPCANSMGQIEVGVRVDYNVVHPRTSLVQSFVLLLQNFEEVVQMIELKRLGGAPNGYPFAPLSENPPLDTLDLELDTFYLVSMSL